MLTTPNRFHTLTVSEVTRETPDAVTVAFNLPAGARDAFTFLPGQYLTLRTEIDGAEVRRSYSICCTPRSGDLRVGIRHVPGGAFSGFANTALKPGDRLDVMPPEGRFTIEPTLTAARDLLLIAAGSGITPILSIAQTVLEDEPATTVTLLYGNRETATVMFREALEDLKDRFLGRLRLIYVMSRETQDIDLFTGRIDRDRLTALTKAGLVDPVGADTIMLCGPGGLIDTARATLVDLGADPARIMVELFAPADGEPPRPAAATLAAAATAQDGVRVETILDGQRRAFTITDPQDKVLDAAHKQGLELPYSCAGGMCCTCRCRIVEGGAEMAVNYSLQPWEIEAGFTLACQARPTTPKLVLDFDAT